MANQMGSDCDKHKWWIRFQTTDDRIVTETLLNPEIGFESGQSLEYEEFSQRNTTALYTYVVFNPYTAIFTLKREVNKFKIKYFAK